MKIHLEAACCLINISNCTLKKYKNSLTRFLITAAKTVIPRHWRNTAAPTIKEWLEEIHLLKGMEEIRATAQGNTENFNKMWQPWIIFKFSDSYNTFT